jgi:hypothetical protein
MTVQSDGLKVFGRNGKVFVRQLILHNCLPKGKSSIEVKVQRGKYNAGGNIELEDSNVAAHIDPAAKIILLNDLFVNHEFGLIVSLVGGGKVKFSPKFAEHEHLRFFTLEDQEMNADAFAIVDKLQ